MPCVFDILTANDVVDGVILSVFVIHAPITVVPLTGLRGLGLVTRTFREFAARAGVRTAPVAWVIRAAENVWVPFTGT